MSDSITWYAVPDNCFSKVIVATVGVVDSGIACIAYHSDFRDFNRDGKVSIAEKLVGLVTNDQYSINMQIGRWLSQNVLENDGSFQSFYVNNLRLFLSQNATLAVRSIEFAYFKIVVGPAVSMILDGAGVTGIRKFVYGNTVNFVIKDLISP